jgi:NAD(P)-dependent dehydrogenase (short-subunit alcohol dehydrogenase family)
MREEKPVCVVVGVGPGNGEAFARRFSDEGYAVALLSRSTRHTAELAAVLPHARAYACDAADADAVSATFERIRNDLGDPDVLLYNAGSGVFGTFDDVGADALENAWRINTLGGFLCAKQVVPAMEKAGAGAIIFTGATASLRGGARFAAFAQAKAAQRSLAQSMARHLWPKGIHVAVLIVDGVVDLPRTRERMPDAPAEAFIAPVAVADAACALVMQNRSGWTFEVDLRPHVEKW